MMKQIEYTGTTHLWILSQEFTIADNALCISFPMSEAYELIKKYRSTIFEGGNFDLIAKVEVIDPNIAAPRRIMHTGVLDLNFNKSAQTPKKSTINGTKKFVIGKVEEVNEAKENKEKCFCGKKHVDLRNNIEFQSQYDSQFGDKEAQDRACFRACKVILTNAGLSSDSAPNDGTVVQIASEGGTDKSSQTSYISINSQKVKDGVTYIDEQLELGYPVLVGVDYKSGSPNSDKTTDHFVVIVGRECSDNEIFYYFYEVGTGARTGHGTSDDNKLYLKKDGSLRGTPAYKTSRNYIVSQIRKNKLP